MDDIAAALSSILSSPDGIDQIKSVASMLGINPNEAVENLKGVSGGQKGKSDFNSVDVESILKIKGMFESQSSNSDAKLLDALKPFLSEKRVEKMEQAKKLMKLMDMLPLLSELGLFKL
jgi:hypothetical protein